MTPETPVVFTSSEAAERVQSSELKVLVTTLCLTLFDLMDRSPPGILQSGTLEWMAISFSRRPSRPRDGAHVSRVSCTGRWILHLPSHQSSQSKADGL